MKTVTKCNANRELATAGKVDFADYGYIAVFGRVEFPVQLEVLVKILPSIAMSDVNRTKSC